MARKGIALNIDLELQELELIFKTICTSLKSAVMRTDFRQILSLPCKPHFCIHNQLYLVSVLLWSPDLPDTPSSTETTKLKAKQFSFLHSRSSYSVEEVHVPSELSHC